MAALQKLADGLVHRYQLAGQPPPILLYTDRDCCSESGPSKFKALFSAWDKLEVRLDIWHFMRRLAVGCTNLLGVPMFRPEMKEIWEQEKKLSCIQDPPEPLSRDDPEYAVIMSTIPGDDSDSSDNDEPADGTSDEESLDSAGIPGWDKVDSSAQASNIKRLYAELSPYDKRPFIFHRRGVMKPAKGPFGRTTYFILHLLIQFENMANAEPLPANIYPVVFHTTPDSYISDVDIMCRYTLTALFTPCQYDIIRLFKIAEFIAELEGLWKAMDDHNKAITFSDTTIRMNKATYTNKFPAEVLIRDDVKLSRRVSNIPWVEIPRLLAEKTPVIVTEVYPSASGLYTEGQAFQCEATHLVLLKSLPKSRTWKRNAVGRAASAAHSVAVGGMGESIVLILSTLGCKLRQGGPASKFLSWADKKGKADGARQRSAAFKSRRAHAWWRKQNPKKGSGYRPEQLHPNLPDEHG
ncbi:Hypp6817 [Branchiostoma lanceolatum]|uniref:Hypp6817 protein n=1 Tax=Branchiostoma lanceolatum TaxID=7740 RepID=A0A8J9YVJ1_BRALA|nr:Hypp6817 [Branchiostoma lanceolatum]